MKLLQIFFLLLVATASTLTQPTISQPKYSEVRIFATSEAEFRKMMDAGLFIDHANRKPGYYLDAWLSENELELLKNSGVPYEILVDDWDVYFNSLPKMSQPEIDESIRQSTRLHNVSHSIYGSMGGYLTFTEVVNKLDSMRLEFPQFISAKFSIGNSYEGRNIWAVRVTKNPDVPTGKPEAMYHALIHAREPESMETQVYYFYWLFENYGIDPIATYVLNNREIYWIPVLNPDGYVHNQTIMPGGGGLWRKNRKPCSGGIGTDLNRNYGTYQFWNSPNGGSSTSCGSDTYRGTSPFSEPETQAIMNFVNSRNFNASFGAHTHGNLLIKPWAWIDPTPTPDDNTFNQFLSDMKVSNPIYRTGTPSQTVGYFVRGGSDDWYYNDSVHTPHRIFAITPETGTSFWPPQNQIVPLAQGMLFNNQYMSLIAGPYVNPLSRSFNQQTYTPGQPGIYKVVFRNKGTMAAGNVTVKWTSTSPRITIPTTQFTYPSLDSFATDSSIFNFTVSPLAGNSAIPTLLTIKLDTATVYTATAYVLVGTGTIVLNDNGNTFANWTTNGTWAVTASQFNSPPSSFTDSPFGNYGNNANNSMTLASPLNATSTPVLFLSFYHRYATEANYDLCNLEVSNDNGTSWQTVVSYSGTLSTWAQQAFDITDFAEGSSQVKIRFRLSSDVAVTGDGWYVDDVRVNGYVIEEPQWYIDDLRDTTNQADYIIVSPPAYASILEPFAAFRSIHDSLNVAIVLTDSIYSTFGQGVAQDSAIKSFFSFALSRWQDPKPEYVLLAGNVNTVPSHQEPGLNIPPSFSEDSVMVDHWFVEGVTDSAFPSRVDAAIGRFPAWNEQQLQTMISKTITYELLTDSSWFSRNIQVADSGEANFFEQASGMWLQTVSSRWPDTIRVHVRENSPFYRTRTQFRDLFNQGATIISLSGHMNFYQFSRSAYFRTWDVDSLSNGGRLPFCILLADQRIEKQDTLCIALNLLQSSEKGAIATLAPSGQVFANVGFQFTQRTFEDMVSHPSQPIGKTIKNVKNTLGEGAYRGVAKQTLLGDPALVIKHTTVTSVPQPPELPQHFALHQNFPNPFNPETIIEFDIVSKGFVTLRVYNILGQEVASLVNEELSQGKYSIKLSTGQYNLASGVYFYRINAGVYSSIKKMLLMK